MHFHEYQEAATRTFKYDNDMGLPPIAFCALGLTEEAGEVAGKIKKYYRDTLDIDTTRDAIRKELGDVLWYLSQVARLWGLTLDSVAHENLAKLADRVKRGVIHGSGDNR